MPPPPDPRRPILSVEVDEAVEFLFKAVNLPAKPRQPAQGENTPLFSSLVDELVELTLPAQPAARDTKPGPPHQGTEPGP